MRRPPAFLALVPFALALLAPLALGQGSVGSYGREGGGGMGGGAGGFGGGGAGEFRSDEEEAPALRANPLVEPRTDASLWTKRSAILTPGVFVEYKIPLKKGEVLFATADSRAFDAALEILSPGEKEGDRKRLAFNDDRIEGDQRPFVSFRAGADGEYRLKVLSFQNVAGGAFDVYFRTLSPVAVVPDGAAARASPEEGADDARRARPLSAVVTLKKGETVQVEAAFVNPRAPSADLYYGMTPRGVVGPTGVDANDLTPLPTGLQASVFTAERDGDFILEYSAGGDAGLAVRAFRVPKSAIGRAGEVSLALTPGRARLVEFPVEEGSLVTTRIVGGGAQYALQAPGVRLPSGRVASRRVPTGAVGGAMQGQEPGFAYFLYDRANPDVVLRSFRQKGTVRVAVYTYPGFPPVTAALRNEEGLPEWKSGETTPKVGIGEAKLLLLKTKRSDIWRVFAKSETYQTRLDIFTLDGELANSLADLVRKLSADDLYFPDGGTYIVRLTSDGFGGSGETVLRKGALPVIAYALGTTVSADLGANGFNLYGVTLEAGKRYELLRTGGSYNVSVLDPAGEFLGLQSIGFDGTVREYIVPLRTGAHGLWLRGSGGATFRLAPYEAPKLTPPPPSRAGVGVGTRTGN